MVKPCTTQNMVECIYGTGSNILGMCCYNHICLYQRHDESQSNVRNKNPWKVHFPVKYYWIESANGCKWLLHPQKQLEKHRPTKAVKKERRWDNFPRWRAMLLKSPSSAFAVWVWSFFSLRSWRLAYNPNRRDLQLWPLKPPQKRRVFVSERLFRKKGENEGFCLGSVNMKQHKKKRRRVWHHIGTIKKRKGSKSEFGSTGVFFCHGCSRIWAKLKSSMIV